MHCKNWAERYYFPPRSGNLL